MNQRHNHALNFVTTMLRHCSALEMAAAFYNAEGKVAFSPRRLKRLITSAEALAGVMAWAGAMNAGPVKLPIGIEMSATKVQNRANIWVRPADQDHAWAFVDDLEAASATGLANEHAAIVVQTSNDSFQAWVLLATPMPPAERCGANKALAAQFGSDPHAISEPRWGRMPGFRQTKPGKQGIWTNVVIDTTQEHAPMQWSASLPLKGGGVPLASQGDAALPSQAPRGEVDDGDGDESAREFAFACHRLRAGWPAQRVIDAIATHAFERGKRGTMSAARLYAERTVDAALEAIRFRLRA
jgi:hypothetical protein